MYYCLTCISLADNFFCDDLTSIGCKRVVYVCNHFDVSKKDYLHDITSHYHIIIEAPEGFRVDYMKTYGVCGLIFNYCKVIDETEIPIFMTYCQNSHCSYKVLFSDFEVHFDKKTMSFTECAINDLLLDKSITYMIHKYGDKFMANYQKLMLLLTQVRIEASKQAHDNDI